MTRRRSIFASVGGGPGGGGIDFEQENLGGNLSIEAADGILIEGDDGFLVQMNGTVTVESLDGQTNLTASGLANIVGGDRVKLRVPNVAELILNDDDWDVHITGLTSQGVMVDGADGFYVRSAFGLAVQEGTAVYFNVTDSITGLAPVGISFQVGTEGSAYFMGDTKGMLAINPPSGVDALENEWIGNIVLNDVFNQWDINITAFGTDGILVQDLGSGVYLYGQADSVSGNPTFIKLLPTMELSAGSATILLNDNVGEYDFSVTGVGGRGLDFESDDWIYMLPTIGYVINVGGGSAEIKAEPAKLAFFGATPVVQPAHPVTLQNVIDALSVLGITAA